MLMERYGLACFWVFLAVLSMFWEAVFCSSTFAGFCGLLLVCQKLASLFQEEGLFFPGSYFFSRLLCMPLRVVNSRSWCPVQTRCAGLFFQFSETLRVLE